MKKHQIQFDVFFIKVRFSMNKFKYILFFIVLIQSLFVLYSQDTLDSIQKLDEVVIENARFSLPISEISHNIQWIDSTSIHFLQNTSHDVLKNLNGLDLRQRGIEGMQSDLYIRGGNFNQSLLLIDGYSMLDLQTGHHMMNGMLNPQVIERVEVVKGSSSRLYGYNAMNGVVNIVTKKPHSNKTILSGNFGSFDTYGLSLYTQQLLKDNSFIFQINKLNSQGYRFNTDFDHLNSFLKFNIRDYELLSMYSQRKFGANGFYASPDYKDQYEETNTGLIAIKRSIDFNRLSIDVSASWRYNDDMYLFLRDNPEYYKNNHYNNQYNFSVKNLFNNALGILSFGADFQYGNLKSNNLGNHNRQTISFFGEQRLKLMNDKILLNIGFNAVNYSDFGFFIYPGIEIGFKVNNAFKIYTNYGLTNRIPTYTNMFYNSPAEEGNPDLKPEKAITSEVGFNVDKGNLKLHSDVFYRQAKDLLDWIKTSDSDKWHAVNYTAAEAMGIELDVKYGFQIFDYNQSISFGYTFMDESINKPENVISRYQLNSFEHQLHLGLNTQLMKSLTHQLNYRLLKRYSDDPYQVIDLSLAYKYKRWLIKTQLKNLLNTKYSEQYGIPMPGFHIMSGLSYTF